MARKKANLVTKGRGNLIANSSRPFEGKRVLVAGGGGFVGTNLLLRLLAEGASPRATVYSRLLSVTSSDIEVLQGDLTSLDFCRKVTKGVDVVILTAAVTSGAAVIASSPLAHLTPNLVMNAYMLQASHENSVEKFCFISSNTVYPDSPLSMKEDDVNFTFFDKYHIVGWMKAFSEVLCDIYSSKVQPEMQVSVLRPSNLYGPFDKFGRRESKVVASLIRKATEGADPIEVWGDGQDSKDFLFIDDFIEALVAVVNDPRPLGPLNVASGRNITIRQLLDAILAVTGRQGAEVKFNADMPSMIPTRILDTERIRNEIGWEPRVTLEEGIRRTVAWFESETETDTPLRNT